MILNDSLKVILLFLPSIIISSCSVYKDKNKQYISEVEARIHSYNEHIMINKNIFYKKILNKVDTKSEIKKLQENNIIYFDLDKCDLLYKYVQILNEHAIFLCKNPSYKVIIEGHTDERETPEYNIALGEHRALAVKIYLQSKGVSPDQISIISYGKEKPAVLGYDEGSYSKNRRAILIYSDNIYYND